MPRVDIAASIAARRISQRGEEMLAALKDRWWYEQWAVAEEKDWLRNDRDLVLAAVKQDGRSLWDASEELRNDRGIVLAAVKQDGTALYYASEELKKDPDIKQTCKK